ncbi:MAG TPA: condensation domain-containing protein, partial [Ruminiclostridium sp.]|nr:condensation domain-containing protein [Ruminiclostridium sp.]
RYLSDNEEVKSKLASMKEPEISFNYLGYIDQSMDDGAILEVTNENCGLTRSMEAKRAYLFEIDSMIIDGKLRIECKYSEKVHSKETIERLTDSYLYNLKRTIEHCMSPNAGGFTPSDFSDFQWTQDDLDNILKAITKCYGGKNEK